MDSKFYENMQYKPTREGETLLGENRQGEVLTAPEAVDFDPNAPKYYIESYGCQMNFSDSEIVASILNEAGFNHTKQYMDADLVLINTCSIREKAEDRIRHRLSEIKFI